MTNLITDHIDIWTSAQTQKTNGGRGRGNSSANQRHYGIKKLRELILELAVRGKLVPQDPNDEPASVLLKKISKEKARLIKEGKIKKEKPLPEISEDEKPFELPEGWEWARLGDIALAQPGFAFKSNSFNENKYGLPLIRIRDVGQPFTGTYYSGGYKEDFLVNNGDYLISMDGQFRVALWSNGLALLNQRVTRLIFFNESIGKRFIADSLQARLLELQGVKAYTTVDHLSGKQISESIIAFPPFAEQHRIVAKVDELMALCDQLEQQQTGNNAAHQALVETLLSTLTSAADQGELIEAWQLIADHFDTPFTTENSIDQLKQTILQLAVMGKLVPQDPNDLPASILLEKIAKEKARLIKEGKIKKQKPLPKISDDEKPFELPKRWEWIKFDYISENSKHAFKAGPFGSSLKKSMYVKEGFKIYGQEQVISGDENYGDYYIDQDKYHSLESCAVKSGDILISLVGTIGKVLVLSKKCQPGIINPRLVKLSLFVDVFKPYIKLMLASPLIQEELKEKSHGGTMNILNLGLLRSLTFPLPPMKEQHSIVAKVDELMALCDTLKVRLNDAQTTQLQLADAIVEQAVA